MKAKDKKLELRKLASAIKVSSFAYAGLFAGLISPMVHAGPEGGVVTGGSGTIDVDGATTTVDQVTDLLSIDWDSFNLSEEELVQFLQPDSSSIVLNRILDQDVTTIQGAIEANGHVILVNPRGVLFTETATVNVGAITASGLDMSPEDFMNGDFAFKGESGSSGVVINRGVINASSAVLVGKQVTNASSGLISAELVTLAAADEALLTFDADGLIGLKVTKEVMENDLGLDSAVLNEGSIDGAQVVMEASVSGDLFTAAVNNEGTITARGIDTSGGKIRLFGSGSGVVNSGTLDASGSAGGEVVLEGDFAEHSGDISVAADSGSGGYVAVLGDEVVVSGNIDARGTSSGGEVLIGGDYQGNNEDVRNAETTMVTAEANIDASGVGDADGGTVIVWADDTTDFGGTILAESGEDGGDGGLVETSGKIYLNLDEDNMFVSTLAYGDGETGTWLLDPGWMDIVGDGDCGDASNCITAGSIEEGLENNNYVINVTDTGESRNDGGYGILVNESISWSEDTTLTLTSYSDVTVDSKATIKATGSSDLIIQAGGAFTNSGTIDVYNFDLTVGYDSYSDTGSDATENTLGDLTVSNAGTITGSSDSDKFTLSDDNDDITITGDNAFSLDTISFSGIEEVDLGGGDNNITAISTATLTDNDYEAETNLITFSNIDTMSVDSLEGSDSADSFEVTGDNSLRAKGIRFSDVTKVDAGDGGADGDSVTAISTVTLTGTANEAETNSITFSYIESVTADSLEGSDSADSFVVTGDNSLTANSINFSSVDTVDAGDAGTGSDSVTAISTVTLTGTANEAETNSITFSYIESVTADSLEGSDSADSFVVTGDNSLTANSINFSSVDTVNAGDAGTGSDSVTAISTVTLTGNDNEAETNSITFSYIESVTADSLEGSDSADSFVVTGDNSLTANSINFSSVDTVNAGDEGTGSDSVTAISTVTLTGNDNEAETNSITFSYIESVTADSLEGSDSADSFVVTGDNSLTANSINFSSVDTVNAGDEGTGSDSVTAISTVTLTGTANEAETNSITFSYIESVTADSLEGSDSADSFVVTGDNSLTANSINFSSVDTVNAGDAGTGSDSVTAISTVTLTGNDNEAETNSITFSYIESVTADSLEGSDSADSFVVTGDNSLTANSINFSSVDTVNAGDEGTGSDSVTAISTVALTGTANEAETNSITFSYIESVTADSLEGSDSADSFVVTGDNSLTANSINFSSVDTVNAGNEGTGSDSVTAISTVTLTGNDNEAETNSITFSYIESVTADSLEGSDSADSFVVTGDNSLTANSINFSSVDTVNAGDEGTGSDSVTAISTVTLTGNDNEAETNSITFSDIESVTADSLEGSDSADSFVVTGDNSLTANSINFSSVDTVDAGDEGTGSDSVTAISTVSLTGTANEAETNLITFSDIESVTADSLEGSDSADSFVVTGDNSLTANSINFSSVDTVDAGDEGTGSDSVTAISTVTLTGTAYEAETNLITFSDIESVTADSLEGSDSADSFVVTGNNSLTANSINFSSVDTVDAGDEGTGSDSVTAISTVSLTGTANEAETNLITFSDIESVTADSLEGSDSADSFVVTGDNSLTANSINFSSVDTVDAGDEGTGSDSVTAISTVSLTGNDNEATSSSITFSDIESITAAGTLAGSSNNDTFVVVSATEVTANEITVTGFGTTIDAADGDDSVTGASGANWALTTEDNKATNSSITFSGVESLVAVSANLEGSSNADAFVLTSDGDVEVNDMTVYDMSEVVGNGSDSLDATNFTDGLTLTDTDKKVSAGTLVFSGISDAETLVLTGTSDADSFTITGDNALDAANISFTSVTTVKAGDEGTGSDSVTATSTVSLTGNDNEATSSSITFSDIESITAAGTLAGSSNNDTFVVVSATEVTANEITVTGFGTTIDAADGDDSVTGASGANWALTTEDNKATNSSITFSGVESLVAVSANLEGSSNADAFVLTSDGDVEVNDMTVYDMSEVVGDGSDSLDATNFTDGLTLTGSTNEVSAGTLVFSGISDAETLALTGTSDADSFTITGDNALDAANISFTSVTTVDAGDEGTGSDSVTAISTVSLTGTANEAETNLITFSDIESVTADSLEGSDSADSFVVTGDNSLTANSINFSSVDTVDAGDEGTGSDSVTAISTVTLTGTAYEAETNLITFSDIESVTADSLEGSDSADSFVVTGDNSLTANSINFSSVDTVDAGDEGTGSDSVTAISTVTLTGTANEAETNSITFSDIESVTADSLEGSDSADSFVVTGDNSLTANSINFSSVDTVNAGDEGTGSDSVTAISTVTLTGTANEAETNSITFSYIESVTADSLEGSDSADSFVVTGNNSLTANSINFSSVDTVDAGDEGTGSDSVTAINTVSLTGTANEAETNLITFSDIESVTADSLEGSDSADSFVVTGDNSLTANSINFSSVDTVDAGDEGTGSDSVTAISTVSLTGTANEAETNLITFSDIESVTADSLEGSDSADSFVVTGDNSLTANSINFSSVDTVDAGDEGTGSDSVTAISTVTLTGTAYEAETNSITFSDIESVTADSLEGSDSADSFVVTGNNSLTANSINFSSVDTVDAGDEGTGSDSVTAISTVTLTGDDYEATTNSITFSDIESVSGGDLEGSGLSDTFEVTGNEALKANQIAFSNIDSVNAMAGTDSVTGASGQNWTLGSDDYEATNYGITFTGVETLVAVNANLVSTSSAEAFVLTSDGDVEVNEMSVSGMLAVVGNGSDSLDATNFTDGLTLTDTDKKVSAGTLVFSGISDAETLVLTGTSDADSFTITGDNALDAANISFTSVTTVKAGDEGTGSDSVTATSTVSLTGNDNEATSSSITFSDIESITAAGTLAGSSNNDTFVVVSATEVTANEITVTGFGTTIDAADGDDSVTGASGANWALTTEDNKATNSSITFSGVESLVAVSANLEGSSNADAFVLTSDGDVEVNDMTVYDMSEVVGDGSDSLDATNFTDGLTLTGSTNEVSAGTLVFSGISDAETLALTGTSDADSFTITGDNALDAANISFTSVTTVDAGDEGTGSDSVTAISTVSLTGTANEAETNLITFSDIESVTADSLEGSDSADSFVVTGDNSLTANSINFSSVDTVDAGDEGTGSDSVTAISTVTLTGTAYEAETNLITFSDIESVTADSLEGSDSADSFVVTGDNSLTANSINFSSVDTVDAGDEGTGSDSVTAISTVTLTGTANEAETNSITFSDIESVTADSLEGSDSADSFVVTGDNSLTANSINFSSVDTVNAGDEGTGSDSVTAISTVTLTGTANEAETNSITFSYIESVTADSLEGSDSADSFVVTGNNSLTANSINFSSVDTVDAGDEGTGSDSVTAINTVSLTGTANEAETNLITFSDIESVTADSLEGSDSADSFVVTGDNSLTANSINFSSVDTVDAGDEGTGSDSVTAISTVSLTGTANEAETNLITFSDIESVTADSLEGSDSADSFVVTGDNSLTANSINFSSVDTVDAGDEGTGSDSVTAISTVTLTGTAYEAETNLITFSDIESVTADSLEGSDSADSFVVTGNNSLTANSINFSSVDTVDAGDEGTGSDSVTAISTVSLTGTANEAETNLITFSDIESVTADSLEGSDSADSFVVTGDNSLTANSINFSSVDTVDAGDEGTGSDSVTAISTVTLTGTAYEAETNLITFSDIESVTADSLEGSDSADSFVVTGDNSLTANSINFSSVDTVDAGDAGTGSDSVTAISTVTLTGDDYEATTSSITFSDIESVSGGDLEGSAGNDTFEVTGNEALKANQIAFSDIDSVNAMDGTDSVTGASGQNWVLGSDTNEATNHGITFTGVETLVTVNANLEGYSNSTETFLLTSGGDVEVNDMTVSGMSEVVGNGDDILDATNFTDGLTLTDTDKKVSAGTLVFSGISDAETLVLTGTSDADSFTITGDNALEVAGINFTEVDTVEAGSGSDSVIGASGADWTLEGDDNEASSSGISFAGVDSLAVTDADLLGSSSADAFTLQSTGDIEVYSMTVSGMSAVDGQGGDDSLDASAYSDSLRLTGTDNQVTVAGLTFDGIVSAVTSALIGTTGADSFTIDGDNAATSYGIAFTGLSTINARTGDDTATGADGADWSLTGTDNEAVNSSITFTNIDNLTAVNADLVATTNDDAFVLQSDADVEVYSMTVSGMSAVDGNGGDDSLDASAYSDGLSLTGTDNQVAAGSLSFYNISSAVTSVLTNTYDSAEFQLQGDQALETAGISFTGLEEVNTSGSNDTLVATDSDDDFTLSSDGDISVAGIDFSGLETVDGAGGSDTVSADGATWTSTSSGNSLVEGSVEAEVNGLTVYFDNLELVEGAGSYIGQDIDGEYEFSALDTMTIGGVTFADLDSVAAGSGTDTVYGADIDAVWDINDSEHTVSSGGESLTITGIESITAGSGADEFNLNGGELTGIDTGAGSDTVTFSGTVIDSISLGAGNDLLTVETDIGQDVELAGGGGSDDFQYNLSGATWEIYSSGNQVGNFSFTGFEYLDNTSDSITVLTDRAFDFEDGGNRSESFNKNGAGLQFSDMRLGYDGEGDIYVTSSSTDTIGGSLTADRAELVVGGDVDIETDVSVLGVATSGADIDISVLAAGDLVIDEIDAGRGTVSLASSSFGILTAETYGDTHITASAVTLGTETELWTIIGEATNPLRMDVTNTLDIYSVSYYEPDFIGQIPTVTSTGDELQSVAGAQASQGLKSAVQNAVEDFSHVDPAIFSAVKPYSSGVDAVNSPEMRLKSGELSPAVASAAEEAETTPKFDAELELGTSDAPSDIAVDLGDFNGGSAGH
ncbi:filamentous hemagglutinin N-terminal domain-containing protein [Microbulbifer sp. VAAF005]|uniref:filamentous hemagglutinin N-terminal domain-containing protein n=1 Tax=Microbulbifer sp. VAAF005 TaxID=3034230 RepID=UPI0024ADCA5C|nr:filamentous hemagglutinin N-terminal domain-containing protein [Microbulbifer sp. VAAF005]WHI44511.1 filamentous hemagglutinin N-terminal domain-containing protein [Microbulbifer sp. VAAF005]